MQMFGVDLNPVAWFIVKNEMAQVDPAAVQALLDDIERDERFVLKHEDRTTTEVRFPHSVTPRHRTHGECSGWTTSIC